MEFINLTWNELTNFNKNTTLKNRQVIIVDLDDNLHRRYNAIVVKYDDNKNVHVRYLDNPFYSDKYWWTGNKKHVPGLNPLSYHAKFLGDEYDEMEHLKRSDFQEDGYDDIINFDKDGWRFFHGISEYPYLGGIQGNVHVNNFYVSTFNVELAEGKVPACIRKRIEPGFKYSTDPEKVEINRLKLKSDSESENILYNILEGLPINYAPVVREYHLNKSINTRSNEDILKDFRGYLYHCLTHQKMREINKNSGIDITDLEQLKQNLRESNNNLLIKVIPFLIKHNIKIFDCRDGDLEIYESNIHGNKKWIYLLKYLGHIETLV